jgi:hypothetical protein
MYAELNAKCLLLLSSFNQNWKCPAQVSPENGCLGLKHVVLVVKANVNEEINSCINGGKLYINKVGWISSKLMYLCFIYFLSQIIRTVKGSWIGNNLMKLIDSEHYFLKNIISWHILWSTHRQIMKFWMTHGNMTMDWTVYGIFVFQPYSRWMPVYFCN